MPKNLTIIATPIGNLQEASSYVLHQLANSQVIFCEKSSESKKLLTLLNIAWTQKQLVSINNYNEQMIVANYPFAQHDHYALISNAGYPLLCDPGYHLVNYAIQNDFAITVANGPSALLHALMVSGFNLTPLHFVGFLPRNLSAKQKALLAIQKLAATIVVYEANSRIISTLQLVAQIFTNPANQFVVCRELSKKFETVYRGSLATIMNQLVTKGEFVIVIDNHCAAKKQLLTDWNPHAVAVQKLVEQEQISLKMAVKMVAYKHDLTVNQLYAFCLKQKNKIQ